MGSITRSFANNITTSGVLLPASLNNNSISNVTSYNAAVATGNMVLISSQTASNSASISFTTGIDSTYKEYQFWFINIYPQTDDSQFGFNGSTDGGSNYNIAKTTTFFRAVHAENDTAAQIDYTTGDDLAQGTGNQPLIHSGSIGNASDENACGFLSLFNPASTTYVKHYISNTSSTHSGDYELHSFSAGYLNTTSAVNAIRFQFASGNISAGTILMYGIK
jgi:hypothetical protein